MKTLSRIALPVIVMGSLALPAAAQTPSSGNATTAPATHDSKVPATTPSQRNATLTD